jgi:regulator of ribonuclease activity A
MQTHRASARAQQLISQLAPSSSSCSSSSCSSSSSSSSSSPSSPTLATADLCDTHASEVTALVLPPSTGRWISYGGAAAFHGPVYCVKVFEDNALVRTTLETDGAGQVLLVDGGGSMRCALVGDQLVTLAMKNHWAGIIVHGAIRDSSAIREMNCGLIAIGTNPVKSLKGSFGQVAQAVSVGGVTVRKGEYVYADGDGILVAKKKLH